MQAVIFDMDGVLTATVEHHYRSWKKALTGYDIPFTRQDNEKLLGLTRHRSLEVILGSKILPEEEMQVILQKKNDHYLESVQRLSPSDLLPGVRELLDELYHSGIPIGVASGSRNALIVLKQLGLERYIRALCDGSQVARSKPSPEIFIKTAQALAVIPNGCLVIEDSQAGVQAGIAAGMCVIGVGPELRLRGAHAVFRDLSQAHGKILEAIYSLWAAVQGVDVWTDEVGDSIK